MYRQITVHPDRRYQKILKSSTGSPAAYQLNTVTYGLVCTPFLALRVLRQLAHDEGDRYPLAIDVILHETYVDDVLSGADTIALAQAKAAQIDQLLMAGGFSLHKWTSNQPEIIADIAAHRHATSTTKYFQSESITRALGLTWHPSIDTFLMHPHFSSPSITTITKHSVISRIAQVFDPLGWITPITIVGKMFLQNLWKLKIDWDDPLSEADSLQWRSFEAALETTSISIPRWLGTSSTSYAIELHGFSDASQTALGAVIYARVLDDSYHARVTLIAAKSKVAPLKPVTIPRLELSAAVLFVRLAILIRTALPLENAPLHLWVDSTVALTWIQGHPSRWKDFVANRVTFIHELLLTARWHHVAGTENPADCASRGLQPHALQNHNLWWTGPPWLSQPSTYWPSMTAPLDPDENLEERPSPVSLATRQEPKTWSMIHRYSTLSRLTRITAWLTRAISSFKRLLVNPFPRPLTSSEIQKAELFWVKQIQLEHFTEEIITEGKSLARSHPLQLRLMPFVDETGILRVGGRLRNSILEPDAKHPILLPRTSALTQLILNDTHIRTLHGGAQLMLATLHSARQRYWILGGRSPVRSFVRSCVRCARFRAAAAKELMSQLPQSRVVPSRPFSHSGVDYAGPFALRTWRGRGSRTYKGFLILFACLATSAVHLEIATDYSSQGFIAAYRRFAGRRGICSSLTSDCGTNFVGADAELRRMFSSAAEEVVTIANELASCGTEWRFNPPAVPHFGGKWEAAVKSVKFYLRRLIGDSLLTYEEFTTLLIQIEAILNSRPLCPLSDDPSDLEALTPAHFLTGNALSTIPEPALTEDKIPRLSRWQFL